MGKIRPSVRSTETYTEQNFLRLQFAAHEPGADPRVTLEHFSCSPAATSLPASWRCLTIVDAEQMTRKDALFIAQSYAAEYGVPVIYECLPD